MKHRLHELVCSSRACSCLQTTRRLTQSILTHVNRRRIVELYACHPCSPEWRASHAVLSARREVTKLDGVPSPFPRSGDLKMRCDQDRRRSTAAPRRTESAEALR